MISISRTAGNRYDKIDKDSWMLIPRYEEMERTSFFDAYKIALAENHIEPEIEQMDISEILKEESMLKND